jgi:hypothetical protein
MFRFVSRALYASPGYRQGKVITVAHLCDFTRKREDTNDVIRPHLSVAGCQLLICKGSRCNLVMAMSLSSNE